MFFYPTWRIRADTADAEVHELVVVIAIGQHGERLYGCIPFTRCGKKFSFGKFREVGGNRLQGFLTDLPPEVRELQELLELP